MKQKIDLAEKITIVVNSCDSYSDLWDPFFTLLKRYWDPQGIRILLNTESKDYAFPGLNIECVHCPGEKKYGKRMRHVLKQVRTKYVFPLLDDFFLRTPVDVSRLEQIVQWMEDDRDIVFFNCDPNVVYHRWEENQYDGFMRLPPGNDYILSMQAAIWRTDRLIKYWRPNVSPWEWEEITNLLTFKLSKDKFYCLSDIRHTFVDYGYKTSGMGVFSRKWVMDDVGPLFEKENITVDYAARGYYDPNEKRNVMAVPVTRKERYDQVLRCLGFGHVVRYFLFNRYCHIMRLLKYNVESDYYRYCKYSIREKFLSGKVTAKGE